MSLLRRVVLGEREADGLWWTTVESAVGIPGMGELGGSSWSVGVDQILVAEPAAAACL